MNSTLKNTELLALPQVKAAIEAGNVILIDKKVTKDPNFTNLYFFGSTEGIRGASSEVSEAAAMLLGWDTKQTDRCIQNAATAVADKFQIGHVFPDFAIRCVDTTEPSFKEQEPRKDTSGNLFYHNGKPIYRNRQIVTKAELASKGHAILEVTTKTAAEQPQGVNATGLLENAVV